MSNYLQTWKPGDEICIIIEDKTGTDKEPPRPRTPEEINKLFTDLQATAQTAGFDLSTWGLRNAFEKSIGKRVTRAQIKDVVAARDHQLASLYPACQFLLTSPPLCLPEINPQMHGHGESNT